jgi:hypothetical protein
VRVLNTCVSSARLCRVHVKLGGVWRGAAWHDTEATFGLSLPVGCRLGFGKAGEVCMPSRASVCACCHMEGCARLGCRGACMRGCRAWRTARAAASTCVLEF